MELQSLIYLLVGASFTIYFGLALWTKASSTKDFYITKNRYKPLYNGISIAVDFISAATFISFGGFFLSSRADLSTYMIGLSGGFVLLIILIIPYLRRFGTFSIPEFMKERYYSNFIKKLSIFIVILVSFLYLAAQLKGAGIIFSRIFQIDLTIAILLSMLITFFYTFIGGMRNIAYTQIAQYIIILFAFMTPLFFLTIELTNGFLPQFAMFSNINFSYSNNIQEGSNLIYAFNNIIDDLNINFTSNNSIFDRTLLAIALMFGVATLPHILIKFFGAQCVKDSRKSIFWALVFVSVIFTSIPALSVLSPINLIKNSQNVNYEDFINDEIIKDNGSINSGKWLAIWQNSKLLEFNDLNQNGIIDFNKNISAQNEIVINPDALSLLNSEIANFPNWVIALFLSGALAATLSTITGLILIIKSTIYYEFIQNKTNDAISIKSKIFSKLSILLIILLAGLFQIENITILQTISFAFTICAATFFPTITLGIFTKKVNSTGAIAGLVFALLFTLLYIIYYLFINPSKEYFMGISPESIGAIGAMFNFFIAIIVSRFTKEIPKNIEELVENMSFSTKS